MAKHKIFIGNYGVSKMRLGDSRSTDYSYDADAELLQIYWRGEVIARREGVKPGDAFIVICSGEEPKLSEMHFPNHPSDFLMYIMGFSSGTRCHRRDFYDKALREQRAKKLTDGREEYEYSWNNSLFNVCEDSSGRPYHLAALVDGELSANDYCSVLCEWPYQIRYPREFLRVSFARRFGMSKQQIERVFSKWGD